MTTAEWDALSSEQRESFTRLQERSGVDFDALRESAFAPTPLCPYVWIPDFHGMGVGIEADGYTHT